MKKKIVKASKTLKQLKTKRTAFAYGGEMNEIITYGSRGGSGSLPSGSYTTNQPSSGAYRPTSSTPAYTGGGGGASTASGYGNTPAPKEVEEIVTTAEPILVSEGFVDTDGRWNTPVYELPVGMGTTGYGAAGSSTSIADAEREKALQDEIDRLNAEREKAAEETNMATPEDTTGLTRAQQAALAASCLLYTSPSPRDS